jgi:hypothetical protein
MGNNNIRGQEVTVQMTMDGKDLEGPSFRVLSFEVTPNDTNTETDFLGETTPDGDTLKRGFHFSMETQEGDSRAEEIADKQQANQDAYLPPPEIMFTVTKQYRTPGAGAKTYLYSEISMKKDSNGSDGKEYVKNKYSGFAKKREPL